MSSTTILIEGERIAAVSAGFSASFRQTRNLIGDGGVALLAFRDLTGVPMVLNTSFNENEPVVCRPEEALDCFLRTEMGGLVMGDTFVSRTSAEGRNSAAPAEAIAEIARA